VLLLFDYDGVIVDSFDRLLELCVEAQRALGHGRAPTADDFRTIENLDFDSVAKLIGIPADKTAEFSAAVFSLQKTSWSVRAFPEIAEVFHELSRDHTIAVVTASQTQAVEATLQHEDLHTSIATVLGGDSGGSKSERIALAREMFSATARNTLMTGDAISDIRQGKQAGVRTVAVSWGFQDRELLANEEPDFIIDNPRQLLDIVGQTE